MFRMQTIGRRLLLLPAFRSAPSLQTRSLAAFPQLANVEIEEAAKGVAHVKLNRPKARNAFTPDLWDDLHVAFDHLHADSACRAVVLSGNGASFCAGIDLKMGLAKLMETVQSEEKDVGRKAFKIKELIKKYQASYTSLESCQKPVITAIHSHCFGAATSLVTAADVRYASKDATFSIKEVDVGLAADVGVLQRIPKIVGNDSWVREVTYTARIFSADEALQQGFVSRLFDTREECVRAAVELAVEIAAKSPIAVQGSKLALNHARNNSIDASLDWIASHNAVQLQSDDLVRIAKAMLEKKTPEFDDL
ncbi:Delta(3,5)-Delta(2,4)-dienoyl-CoA isomerase, mitochondrial [Aphelenchoides fujianensis]|nr:Delta(3,5)-Delta(2,4)-dienoyl-CoA isomerase, mitochondrial [Aphelenchoides fujianensis]